MASEKLETGKRMWAFNTATWDMSPEEYELGQSLVLPEEKERINRFIFKKDRKSALAGRLLIRRLLNEVMDIPYKEIPLQRTTEKKPCLDFSKLSEDQQSFFPFFNFNLSHHGNWVVLVSDPEYLIGVDVMQTEISGRNKEVQPFFHTMRNCFTKYEWMQIYQTHHYSPEDWSKEKISKTDEFPTIPSYERENLTYFMKFWTLKESYIKGVGIGLGMELQDFFFRQRRVGPPPLLLKDFDADLSHSDAEVCVRGTWLSEWVFKEMALDDDHMIAIGYGPPHDSLPSFSSTVPSISLEKRPTPSHHSFCFNSLEEQNTVFTRLSFQDLIPKDFS